MSVGKIRLLDGLVSTQPTLQCLHSEYSPGPTRVTQTEGEGSSIVIACFVKKEKLFALSK
jgi:hypothetical protein